MHIYVKVETQCLDYIHHNQQQFINIIYHYCETSQVKVTHRFRVEQYQGFQWIKSIAMPEKQTSYVPDRIVILPSTFQGSPRSLLHKYQDAMAMIAKFELFLT